MKENKAKSVARKKEINAAKPERPSKKVGVGQSQPHADGDRGQSGKPK